MSISGSSPRVWGTRRVYRRHKRKYRFIPTGVGNTTTATPTPISRPVHPHGCGEHPCRPVPGCASFGSSPRVWGTRPVRKRHENTHRFIPTGVGNTTRPPRRRAWLPVHPHGCGEHRTKELAHGSIGGSSPRAWGTPDDYAQLQHQMRFIPTGVGNTAERYLLTEQRSVHPHGCGEHIFGDALFCESGGSSPRVWGTPSLFQLVRQYGRFIPTGVGNTC